MITRRLMPDVAVCLDVTHATDTPGIDHSIHGQVKMGGGPSVTHGTCNHPNVIKRILEVAKKKLAKFIGIKQLITVNSGSSANLIAFSTLTSPKLKERAIKPSDEVITVAAGFPTTVTPILQNPQKNFRRASRAGFPFISFCRLSRRCAERRGGVGMPCLTCESNSLGLKWRGRPLRGRPLPEPEK